MYQRYILLKNTSNTQYNQSLYVRLNCLRIIYKYNNNDNETTIEQLY